MRPPCATLIAVLAIALSAISSPAQGKIEVYGGYSYLRPAFPQTESYVCMLPPCPLTGVIAFPPQVVTTHPNFNGWNASGSFALRPWLGAKADFGGDYGAALGASSARLYTFLFGLELHRPGKISPFVEALFGDAHASSGSGTISNNPTYNVVLSGSESAFASAFGGGVDVKVKSALSLRVIQVDDLLTRFQAGTQNQPRVSAGVVLRFGK
jgi:hypothetical protein